MTDEAGKRGGSPVPWVRALALLTCVVAFRPSGTLGAQSLEGRVLRADSAPVADALVELHRITADSGAIVDAARTRADGGFRFVVDPAVDPGAVYLASARYSGILYWGPPVHGGSAVLGEGAGPFTIAVYDTAAVGGPSGDLVVGIRHVVLTPGRESLQVDEVIDVKGPRDRTLVSIGDSVPVWQGSLGRGARGATPTTTDVSPQDMLLRGSTVGLLGVLPPGGARLGVSYFVASLEYVLTLEHPTDRLEVLVVDVPGLEVDATGVREAPTERADRGAAMRRFAATDLAAGATIRLRLGITEPGSPAVWPWLTAAVLLSLGALASRKLADRGA